jgi:galactokinase
VRHIVTENARVLDVVGVLRSGDDPRRIGPALTASHASMRDDFEITVPEVDTAVTAALDAGAHGARMTGGGFGGCVLALVDADAVETVSRAVEAAFAGAGFRAPSAFVAVASDGARRL